MSERWKISLHAVGVAATVGTMLLGGYQLVHAQPSPRPAAADPAATPTSLVWFNRRSGVYHLPNCRHFHATADGLFVNAEEAQRIGLPCGQCIGQILKAQGKRTTNPRGAVVLP